MTLNQNSLCILRNFANFTKIKKILLQSGTMTPQPTARKLSQRGL